MAVLVEAISVIVRRDPIAVGYPGGWDGFVADCPNQTLCADTELARVGFMSAPDVEEFCRRLGSCGLVFLRDGQCVDIAVVDQMRGPTAPCDWIEFGHVDIDGHPVAACRLTGRRDSHLITPDGWQYEGSLSASFGFVPDEHLDKSLAFLRHEDGLDVYCNRLTGKLVYVGRTATDGAASPKPKRGDSNP